MIKKKILVGGKRHRKKYTPQILPKRGSFGEMNLSLCLCGISSCPRELIPSSSAQIFAILRIISPPRWIRGKVTLNGFQVFLFRLVFVIVQQNLEGKWNRWKMYFCISFQTSFFFLNK